MKKRSKRYKELTKLSTKNKKVELKDLIELVKKTSTTKFDESIDVSLRINLKQTKGGDFNLRTVFKLPEGSGKKSRVAVLCEADKVEDAKKSGAEVYGSDDLIEKIAKIYHSKINVDAKMPFDNNSSYHLYWILVQNRSKFRINMKNMGVETGIHYNPIHTMSMYKSKTKLPITENVGKKIVSIPIHPNLSDNDVEKIINSVNKFL